MPVVLGVDQLRRHADGLTGLAYAALDDVPHLEFAGDLGDADLLVPELERRGSRRDRDTVGAHQQVENFLGQALRKIFLVALG